jgi:hypothetical protein
MTGELVTEFGKEEYSRVGDLKSAQIYGGQQQLLGLPFQRQGRYLEV